MYKTNSLTLASYLRTVKELEFKGVDRSNPEKVEFVFEPDDVAEKSADDFFAGKDGYLELFKNYRVLKDMIFEIKRNNNHVRSDK
jgi:hypothetical protein